MIGILLVFISEFFHEAASTLSKRIFADRVATITILAVVGSGVATVFFLGIALLTGKMLVVPVALIPIFGVRIIFEIVQAEFQFRATALADRSTYAVFRALTIPALLVVDLFLGYDISGTEALGMGIVMVAVILASFDRKIGKGGIGFVVGSAFNAVVTITLYKYLIDHGTSVAAAQGLTFACLFVYFAVAAAARYGAHAVPLVFDRRLLTQAFAYGCALALASFAYATAPASIILTALRASSLFWSVVSGWKVFHEKHVAHKIAIGFALVAGLSFLGGGE